MTTTGTIRHSFIMLILNIVCVLFSQNGTCTNVACNFQHILTPAPVSSAVATKAATAKILQAPAGHVFFVNRVSTPNSIAISEDDNARYGRSKVLLREGR